MRCDIYRLVARVFSKCFAMYNEQTGTVDTRVCRQANFTILAFVFLFYFYLYCAFFFPSSSFLSVFNVSSVAPGDLESL